MNSPLLARPAYGSFVLCSRDESGTASRTKPFIGNSWRYFSELCSVLDTTFIGAMHRIGVETSYILLKQVHTYYLNKFIMTILISYSYFFLSFDIYYTALICRIGKYTTTQQERETMSHALVACNHQYIFMQFRTFLLHSLL